MLLYGGEYKINGVYVDENYEYNYCIYDGECYRLKQNITTGQYVEIVKITGLGADIIRYSTSDGSSGNDYYYIYENKYYIVDAGNNLTATEITQEEYDQLIGAGGAIVA